MKGSLFVPVLATALLVAGMLYQGAANAPAVAEAPKVSLADIPGYVSAPVAPSEAERKSLPRDTRIEKRAYRALDGSRAIISVVTGGREKASIHRPELCLPAQGFQMLDPRTIPTARGDWRALTLGRRDAPPQGFAYTFFNQDGYRTSSHVARIFRDVWDRSFANRIDRWVMVTVQLSEPGDAALSRFLAQLETRFP